MAKRSTKPVPSGIVRALAEQLRRDGAVWDGRGRRSLEETRPALISVLMARLGLSRSVIQRALHGRSRAAPRQGSRYDTAGRSATSRSESRSEITRQGPKAGSNSYYRAITAAMAAAHTRPGSRAERPALHAPRPAEPSSPPPSDIPKHTDIKHLEDLLPVSPIVPPVPGARGLEAIGLQTRPQTSRPQALSPVPASTGSQRASNARPNPALIQARQVLEDGIDVMLSQGEPTAELRQLLLEVQRVLAQRLH